MNQNRLIGKNAFRISAFMLISAMASVSFCSARVGAESTQFAVKDGTVSGESNLDWKRFVMELRARKLSVALDGYDPEQMKGAFYQGRVGHTHNAVDMVAPRDTPIQAVEDGTVGRLFESVAGGLTIYQKDLTGKYVYYYAHLERYAEGLKDGDPVKRGQIIGYVGTSGNAPPNTPHLHFAISAVGPDGNIFKGRAFDPYEVYTKDLSAVGKGGFLPDEKPPDKLLDKASVKTVEKTSTELTVAKNANRSTTENSADRAAKKTLDRGSNKIDLNMGPSQPRLNQDGGKHSSEPHLAPNVLRKHNQPPTAPKREVRSMAARSDRRRGPK
jgi:peptidoglycan LD-endopeptidase LytH